MDSSPRSIEIRRGFAVAFLLVLEEKKIRLVVARREFDPMWVCVDCVVGNLAHLNMCSWAHGCIQWQLSQSAYIESYALSEFQHSEGQSK